MTSDALATAVMRQAGRFVGLREVKPNADWDNPTTAGSDRALVDELRSVFVADSRARIQTMKTLACPRDSEVISREAHSFKSSSAMLGLNRLSHYAKSMERGAGDLEQQTYASALATMEQEFESSIVRLDEFLRKKAA